MEEPDDLAPRQLETQNDYYGVYFTNTMDVTDQFALTIGGRYNHATIELNDLTGQFDELDTTNKYQRFNPMVGGTYKFSDMLTLYGSYSEANRAPTAAELGCAEPENPCLIESFLTDDPPLEQVVSKSFELGVRGQARPGDGQLFTWSAGLFRTLNQDDIFNVAAEDDRAAATSSTLVTRCGRVSNSLRPIRTARTRFMAPMPSSMPPSRTT